MLNHHALRVAPIGLATITAYELVFSSFQGDSEPARSRRTSREWVLIVKLFLCIVGFAMLARHVEEGRVPILLPALRPDDWKGGFAMLVMVFVLHGSVVLLLALGWHPDPTHSPGPGASGRIPVTRVSRA